jgi:hypothetical protein
LTFLAGTRQEKEILGTQTGKEKSKLSRLEDDTFLHLKTLKSPPKTLTYHKHVKQISKIKNNIQKLAAFLSNNEQTGMEIIPIHNSFLKTKISRNKFNKVSKSLL